MSELGFFDEVADTGNEILTALRGQDKNATFLRRTRDVYELLASIHDDLLDAAVEVGVTDSLEEGKRVLKSLHHDALESVFRARRWCDELEALGRDLSQLPGNVVIADGDTWLDFTSRLQQREGEVARMYEEAMWGVTSRAESAQSLDELKQYMDSIGTDLVAQKARFDLLAKRAAALARRSR